MIDIDLACKDTLFSPPFQFKPDRPTIPDVSRETSRQNSSKQKVFCYGLDHEIIQPNLTLLDRFFATRPQTFHWPQPQAGSIAFPELASEQKIEDFAAALVQQEGVLLLPGSVYDYPGNHFRIGFGRQIRWKQ